MPFPTGKTARELGIPLGAKLKVVDADGRLKVGDIVTLDEFESVNPWVILGDGERIAVHLSLLDWAERTLDTLIIGDIVVDSIGSEREVLAVLAPGLYVLSRFNNFNHAGDIYTAQQLKDYGYIVKQDEPAKPREVTMAQVAEKFGEEVVIKKED